MFGNITTNLTQVIQDNLRIESDPDKPLHHDETGTRAHLPPQTHRTVI